MRANTARRTAIRLGMALVLGAGLCACTAQFRNHGYVPIDEDLSLITPGVDTRDTVSETIGTPSSGGVLNESGYYYVRSRVKHFAWQKPEVVDRRVVAITFDQAGVVDNIGQYELQDGNVVPITRRVTRNGQDVGLIRKLLSNIGGFSAADLVQ